MKSYVVQVGIWIFALLCDAVTCNLRLFHLISNNHILLTIRIKYTRNLLNIEQINKSKDATRLGSMYVNIKRNFNRIIVRLKMFDHYLIALKGTVFRSLTLLPIVAKNLNERIASDNQANILVFINLDRLSWTIFVPYAHYERLKVYNVLANE